MKKSNAMRINNDELRSIYNALNYKVCSFVDHYTSQGEPVFKYSEENEITLACYYKFFMELNKRGLYNA